MSGHSPTPGFSSRAAILKMLDIEALAMIFQIDRSPSSSGTGGDSEQLLALVTHQTLGFRHEH